jgi:Tat protein secretion system quality control protein TatD with DNase activity
MKNLKLWTLTFVIGIAGVFTTTNLPSNHSEKSKTPVENLLLETTITNKTEIGDKNSFSKKNSLDKEQVVSKNKTTDIIEIVNNYDTMNSKNSQVRQIRNYSYVMSSDIMKKE